MKSIPTGCAGCPTLVKYVYIGDITIMPAECKICMRTQLAVIERDITTIEKQLDDHDARLESTDKKLESIEKKLSGLRSCPFGSCTGGSFIAKVRDNLELSRRIASAIDAGGKVDGLIGEMEALLEKIRARGSDGRATGC